MKKMISFLLIAAVLSLSCVSALAATEATTTETGTNTYTTAGTIDDNANKFVTIVVHSGNAISVDSVQYIDQTQADANGAFSFPNYLTKENVPSGSVYYVKVGATALSAPIDAGTIGSLSAPTYTISGQVSSLGNVTTVTVVATDKADSSKTYSGTVADTGAFTIEGVPAGSYAVAISKNGSFTETIDVTVSDANVGDITNGVLAMVSGDITGDNRINASDLSPVLSGFGTTSGADGFNTAADITDDGRINASDLSPVLTNFGVTR